jgi:DNA-binding transcriptional ArsR family regulator
MKEKPSKNRLKRKAIVDSEVIESRAFRKLSAADMLVYLRCLQKRSWTKHKHKIVYTDEPFGFPYSEATQVLGIGRSTFRRAIRRLHERGFIKVEHQGGSFEGKDYSRYSLSEDWRQYGTPDFKPRKKLQTVRPGHDVRSWQRKKQAAGRTGKGNGLKTSTRICTELVQDIVPVAHYEGA